MVKPRTSTATIRKIASRGEGRNSTSSQDGHRRRQAAIVGYDQAMAALSDRYPGPIIELRRVSSLELEPVLQEETEVWDSQLDWDFRPSADLVRRFIDMRGLTGFALMVDARVAGYSYFVYEEGKGLIGDLYVLREHCTVEYENALLRAVLRRIVAQVSGVRRVEAQLHRCSPPVRPCGA